MAYRIGQIVVSNSKKNYDDEYKIVDTLELENVIDQIQEVTSLSHLGIQSRPGAVFAIEDEVIVIGRSGTYEISSNLISVEQLYLLSEDTFIIDYRY